MDAYHISGPSSYAASIIIGESVYVISDSPTVLLSMMEGRREGGGRGANITSALPADFHV